MNSDFPPNAKAQRTQRSQRKSVGKIGEAIVNIVAATGTATIAIFLYIFLCPFPVTLIMLRTVSTRWDIFPSLSFSFLCDLCVLCAFALGVDA